MSRVCTIGLDIAKNFFQVHGEDQHGKVVITKKLSRSQVTHFFANLPSCLVGIEACGGAHHWGRQLLELGHDVRLIPPRLVKPFVINNKTDAADARAICEVVRRPSTKFVQIKSVDQQYLASLHCVRERRISERTALINQMRGLLYEIGIIIPQGISKFKKEIVEIIDSNNQFLPYKYYALFTSLYNEFLQKEDLIDEIDKQIKEMSKSDPQCKRLMEIPGVGVLTATATIAHFGDCKQFKNGRQLAACIGLTPREYSSGGKQKLGKISKRGDTYIRKLLIQGARVICRIWCAGEVQEYETRKRWLNGVVLRRGKFVAAVAQANKTARIIWNVLAKDERYREEVKAA